MRSDIPLYVIALISFAVTGYVFFVQSEPITPFYLYGLIVLGTIFVGLGYMARPKQVTQAIPFSPLMVDPHLLVEQSGEVSTSRVLSEIGISQILTTTFENALIEDLGKEAKKRQVFVDEKTEKMVVHFGIILAKRIVDNLKVVEG